MNNDTTVTVGSGNVFEDMGMPEPRERQVKAQLALSIGREIAAAGWTQSEAARRMGVAQPDVSCIVNGRLKGITIERLLVCLDALGLEVSCYVTRRQAVIEEPAIPLNPNALPPGSIAPFGK